MSVLERRRVASAWMLSFGVHAAAMTVAGYFALHSLSAEARHVERARAFFPRDAYVDIELPRVAADSIASAVTHAPDEPAAAPRGGGEAPPRPDTGTKGRGGTDTSSAPAINLADRDEGIVLSREVLSRLDRSQIQRIKSARERASREDWRASREPMELTFVAMGKDERGEPERRRPSDASPSAGARESGNPTRVGTALGGEERPAGFGEPAHDLGSPDPGADRASAGLGARAAAPGYDHRDSARVPLARPMVPDNAPSIPAETRGKAKDNVDAEQEVATAIQSLVHASAAGGAVGRGPGGQDGPGATGSGGVRGAGSRASALGTGAGVGLDTDPRDRRRMLYLRQVMAKITTRCIAEFPKWAIAEGLQGTVFVSFTIQSDGSVAGVRVARPSGVAEFDEGCRAAVVRAAPYPPLPAELGTSLRWSMPFEARNPAVVPRSASASRTQLTD